MKRFMHFWALWMLMLAGARSFGQEGMPVYYDYFADNFYLVHPALAGAGTCSKVRYTGRMQWMGVKDFPMLHTISLSTHLGKKSGFGIMAYNDRNGYHHQTGMQVTFAHHITLSEGEKINKLSFGLSALMALNRFNTTPVDPHDPAGGMVKESGTYFNMDVGMSYHYANFFLILTAKNFLPLRQAFQQDTVPVSLRNFIFHTGLVTGGKSRFHLEPSLFVQYKDYYGDLIADVNLKAYHDLQNGSFFYGLSYRNYLNTMSGQPLQDFTPVIGFYAGKFFAAYLYTYQLSPTTFSNGGFHQISLGYNFDCRPHVYRYACPHLQ